MNISPPLFSGAHGSKIRCVDGRELTDFVCAEGAVLLGHADPDVTAACAEALARGLSFGMPDESDAVLTKLLCGCVPFIEKAALTGSPSEAVAAALRIAADYTKKTGVLSFSLGPESSGFFRDRHRISWGDEAAARSLFRGKGGNIGAVLAAPVSPGRGFVHPPVGFLRLLRELCTETGAVLIFDEDVSAFRYGFSAFATFCGIRPDLICFGRLLGGGLPLGAVGGDAGLLEHFPEDSGFSPVSAWAGRAALLKLEKEDPFARIDDCVKRIQLQLNAFADDLDFHIAAEAGMFTAYFKKDRAGSSDDAEDCDVVRYGMFRQRMLDRGFYLPLRQHAPAFVTAAHKDEELDLFIEAARKSLEETFEIL